MVSGERVPSEPRHRGGLRWVAAPVGWWARRLHLDARTGPPLRGLGRRSGDGQPHRRGAGGAPCSSEDVRRPWSSRRPRGSVRGRSARWSTSRRTRSTSRRRSWTWRYGATCDRGDPEGGVVREAGLDGCTGRTKPDDDLLTYERTSARRAVQGRERAGALQPEADVLRAPRKVEDELYADAVERGWFLKRPDTIRASMARAGRPAVHRRPVLTFVLAVDHVRARWASRSSWPGCSSRWGASGCPARPRKAPRSLAASEASAP